MFFRTIVQKITVQSYFFLIIFFLVLLLSYTLLHNLSYLTDITTLITTDALLTHKILYLGVFSGLLQLLGYILYLKISSIDPNPVTWFMFAYGTLVLAILEWDASATTAELILPTVCGLMAIVVSARCWLQARAVDPSHYWPRDWWPENRWDKISFLSDIAITIAYILAWILAGYAILTAAQHNFAVFSFLFLSNLSTFPAFFPILHSTYQHPEREHWLPWMVWSLAYVILGWITFISHGELLHALMFYPVSNAIMHALVAIIATRK